MSIEKQACCLCGSVGSHIVESIERRIRKDECPLCGTMISGTDGGEQSRLMKLIEKNDETIFSKNIELESLILAVERKKKEFEKAEFEFGKAREKITEFTEDYPDLSFKGTGNQTVDSLIDQYRSQFARFDREAKEEYKKRDNLKPEYERLLRKVEATYRDAEKSFVPTFKKLAKSFIGLELNIQPIRDSRVFKLVLELGDTARTTADQLSESQRFFLDIALRMSLAIFLSGKRSGATMLIDTPEGSLDIAYESRVGNMFAEFVIGYNQNLLMTANINASQLLVVLAENCGRSRMKIRRMLDWTDMSTIQKEGEDLFQKVFGNLEKALGKREK